jgi:carboxymethylenebutenolidase
MDERIIRLYDEYTHAPLPRRVFLERLAALAGSSAAATALLPLLDNNYARAATVAVDDARIAIAHIRYKGASSDIQGYLATPKSGPARRGSVIVVHENRGLNPHIEDVARRIALEGLDALAVDLLSPLGGTPSDEDRARLMFGSIDRNTVHLEVVPAIAYLRGRDHSNGRVGAIGFCFGGQVVNQLATAAPDLAAAVVFYGRNPPLAQVPRIRARLQLHYAGNDAGINAGVPEYESALKQAGVQYEKYLYDGVEHAFHNDTGGARYDKPAADLAWQRAIAFLKTALA